MTLSAANAKKMLFTLRYPPDKILGTFEGSFTATAMSGNPELGDPPKRTIHTVATHGFGAPAYLQMRYSVDGGVNWQQQHFAIIDDIGGVPQDEYVAGCYCTSTQVLMVAQNRTNSNVTVTYEIVAFAKPGETYNVIPTVTDGQSKFVLSTRFNIQKIYMEEVSIPLLITSSSGTIQEYTLATHSLGYIPHARVFYTLNSNELWPLSSAQYIDEDFSSKCNFYGSAVLTNTQLKLRMVNSTGSNATVNFHYRIYLDE
jgi:hypothetical protein